MRGSVGLKACVHCPDRLFNEKVCRWEIGWLELGSRGIKVHGG